MCRATSVTLRYPENPRSWKKHENYIILNRKSGRVGYRCIGSFVEKINICLTS